MQDQTKLSTRHEALWNAINAYAAACGADTSSATMSLERMNAVAAIERILDGQGDSFPCAAEQLAGIRDRLKREQEYDRYHFADDHPLSSLVRILDAKRCRVATVIQHSWAFQEDVLSFLRAFGLMLETVASATTHGEKAARLRGLIELVETAATRVRDRQFRESDAMSFSMADDVFRCDYPVRHWIEKAREAEEGRKAAEHELATVRSVMGGGTE